MKNIKTTLQVNIIRYTNNDEEWVKVIISIKQFLLLQENVFLMLIKTLIKLCAAEERHVELGRAPIDTRVRTRHNLCTPVWSTAL